MTAHSVAIVTGASQGIGQATAIRLTRDFSAVVLVARSKDNLETTGGQVKAAGAEVLVHSADLARTASRRERRVEDPRTAWPHRRVAQHCRSGAADGLVRNERRAMGRRHFAQVPRRPSLDHPGVGRVEGFAGSVVLISGSAAFDPKPGFAAVAAINAAIIALAKAFAERGIREHGRSGEEVP